jgi:CBS domain-containing protein
MQIDETTGVAAAMSPDVLTVGPGHTLRQVSQAMTGRKVGAAVVVDSDASGVGIITERDILRSLAAGEDPDTETARDHQTTDIVYATPTWTLGQAAEAMMRGGFRHLVVFEANDVAGMLSVRDIVREWARQASA